MLISQTAEYALRAVLFLAMHPDGAYATLQISASTKVPQAYLSKVLQSLSRAGIVQSQRGLRGGFTLRRPASELTILQILDAVDPLQRIRTCPLGVEGHGIDLCALHRQLDNATAEIEKAFGETTLQHLLNHPTKSVPLCRVPETGQT